MLKMVSDQGDSRVLFGSTFIPAAATEGKHWRGCANVPSRGGGKSMLFKGRCRGWR